MRPFPPEARPAADRENGQGALDPWHVPGGAASAGVGSADRMIAAVLCVLALAVLAVAVLEVPALTSVDADVLTWLAAHRTPGMTTLMLAVTALSGPSATSVYAAVVVAVCLVRRQRRLAVAVVFVAYGGMILNVALKHLVHRPRPEAAHALQTLETYSFPSGHAAAVTVFGALLVMLLSATSSRTRAGVIVAVVLWIVLAGTSRMYLGAHYPSDVVAGVAEGVAWGLGTGALLEHWHVRLVWSAPAPAKRCVPS